jgi:hypothetical protein
MVKAANVKTGNMIARESEKKERTQLDHLLGVCANEVRRGDDNSAQAYWELADAQFGRWFDSIKEVRRNGNTPG